MNAAFGMWHEGQVTPIRRTHTGNAKRRTIGVHWVYFGDGIGIVDVADGSEVLAQNRLKMFGVGK